MVGKVLYGLVDGMRFLRSNLTEYTVPDWHNTVGSLWVDFLWMDGLFLFFLVVWVLGHARMTEGLGLWWCLLLAFVAYLAYVIPGGILFGGASSLRYLMFGVVFVVILLAGRIRRLTWLGAVVLLMIGWGLSWKQLPENVQEVREAADWINGHRGPGDAVAVDFARWEDMRLALLTSDAGGPVLNQCWSNQVVSSAGYPEALYRLENRGELWCATAFRHLQEVQVRYVVFTSEPFYREIVRARYEGMSPHYRSSYYRPYLDRQPPAHVVVLSSPYQEGEVLLKKRWENARFYVYERM
jgi:hypothetical protein